MTLDVGQARARRPVGKGTQRYEEDTIEENKSHGEAPTHACPHEAVTHTRFPKIFFRGKVFALLVCAKWQLAARSEKKSKSFFSRFSANIDFLDVFG